MDAEKLTQLLRDVQSGKLTVNEAVEALRTLPFEDIGDAMVDHHRQFRRGFPEVIMGEGKTADQVVSIARSLAEKNANVLITRIEKDKVAALRKIFPDVEYHSRSRTATLARKPIEIKGTGTVLIVTAGTSDIPVAEEALVTAQMMGNEAEMICDVGVAGIHRLLHHREKIMRAHVLIVVAGMEGALPSVVGGLVNRPVIAVPTSTGYGVSFQGVAALLGMLNSCAAGVAVVNIDNGFGAAYMASLINQPQEKT
jgi:NCAIR mutase (PurE)-related protein